MITIIFSSALAFCLVAIFSLIWRSKLKNFPPGPMSLPFIGGMYALSSMPHRDIFKLSQKYGNIIGIDFASTRTVVLNDLDTIKHAFSLKEFNGRPHLLAIAEGRGLNTEGLVWSDSKVNEEQRQFMMKNFKVFGTYRKSMEILIQEQLRKVFQFLDKSSGSTILNEDLFCVTTVSVLWTALTGVEAQKSGDDFQKIVALTKKAMSGLNVFVCYFPTMAKLFPNISGWNKSVQSNIQLHKFIDEKIQFDKKVENSKDQAEAKDFISAYKMKIQNTKDPFSSFFGQRGRKNMSDVLFDLIMGGTETVAVTLTWFLAIIIRHPEIQQKIQTEINRVIGNERMPSLSDREKMPYAEACVLETLRFPSVAPLGVSHYTLENVTLQGYNIPKDTVILANLYGALHDPKHWDEPHVFKPERFFNEDGSSLLRNVCRNVDFAFGHGKKICPGISLAKDQLFLFITGLCQRYSFQPDPKCIYKPEIEAILGLTLIPKPHTLIISKRTNVC